MKTLSISLDVISPLAVRSDHAASRTANSKYIPGNTLLGSLATIHRVLRPEEMEEFERFFLSGETLYSNLYPAKFESKEIERIEQGPVYPIPKTAQSCKRYEGFRPNGHGVRDSLADWALFNLGESFPSHDRLKAFQECKTCKFEECGEPLHHFDGYYRHSTINPERIIRVKNDSRLQTRTGIDRESGTVREGILYNRQVFEEGSKFWGEIRLPVDEALVASFDSFLWAVKDSHLLRMGTGRTRGMGKVEIEFKEVNASRDSYESFEERITMLDKFIHTKIKGVWEERTQLFKDKFFFALTLHSPAILTDEFLRYRSRIDADVLCELLDIDKISYSLRDLYINFSNRRITGWQELWGTPRTNEYAIDTGSVFLFQCDKSMQGKLVDRLFNLEEQGIGKRRTEGFGRVGISDSFHMRGEQE